MARVTPILAMLVACCAQARAAQLPGGAWSLTREHPGFGYMAETGHAVAAVGDWDGDGVGDYAVGSPGGATLPNPTGHVEIHSGATGTLLYRYPPVNEMPTLGRELLGGEDLDGDGIDDLVASSDGRVYVFSGANGALAGSIATGVSGREAMDWAGDVDGDGVADLVVGNAEYGFLEGEVRVYSGATLGLIRFLPSSGGFNAEFGWVVSGIGDIDGDGAGDFAATMSYNSWGGDGELQIYSGGTGFILHQVPLQDFNVFLAAAGDVDGDGYDDFLLSVPTDYVLGHPGRGWVSLVRGGPSTLTTVWRRYSWLASQRFGGGLCMVTDFDGDGLRDFVVGSPDNNGGSLLTVHSTATGAFLHGIPAPRSSMAFGASIAGLGDEDGDGIEDLLVGAPADAAISYRAGSAHLVRLDPWLEHDGPELGASPGSQLQFTVDFPVSEAGQPYALLATTGGVGATPVPGVDLPLASSNLLGAMLAGLQPSLLVGGRGTLNSQGDALAVLHGGAPVAPFVGRTLWLAAVTWPSGGSVASLASAPRWVRVVP